MRHDRRYRRVHDIITHPEIPRFPDGDGVRLCHFCQRRAMFAGGFLELIIRQLEAVSKRRSMADQLWHDAFDRLKVGKSDRRIIRGEDFHQALRAAVILASERNGWHIRYQRSGDKVVVTRLAI